MQQQPDLDIAIVGGGVGGIYTGWRLMTSTLGDGLAAKWARERGGALKVTLFEGSDRIGGRLLSARSPHMPDTTAEIGGMRYVSPAQTRMKDLVENVLKLPTHQQVVDVANNIAFLRGHLLRTSQLGNPDVLPYWFDPAEAKWLAAQTGASPAELITRELIKLMPEIPDKLKSGQLRQYLLDQTIDGLPLWQHAFWNLLAKYISPDGYNAARTTVGYDCLGGNTNALDLITEYFDFAQGVEYRMVNEGYEAVPWQLQQRFHDAGGEIEFNCWLDGFVGVELADGSKGVQLDLRDGRKLTARAIVLAMPRRAIELLRPEGEVLDPRNTQFRHDLASVRAIPLFKCFLLYPESWWQAAGVSSGRSLTDLPLRQCYYWPVGSDGVGVPKPSEPGLVMAYDDLLNVDFWAGLDTIANVQRAGLQLGAPVLRALPTFNRAPSPPMSSLQTDEFSKRLLANWEAHKATQPMVDELHRQLLQMHGIESAPKPTDAAYMDWSRDPYGGGVHLWNVNYNSAEMLKHMTQPVANFPCYICGEAYSTNQTWAEGALETADIVLHRLGLP
ncbi:FAD-dependent oxidoreductase [Bradyrhizobium sp. Leo170]|uniref:flavin monoamine oxidase family protein n=1 Tax=Bradyrhizobium sp. Leo170 TaxID=1571199 RepID=UPI00102ED37D|nr:FAD-dependent oxidoreductase [Bradyrhizobium sp. Leo170]TAI65541.1 amine oxidase [Bradyrhizobium sp. Leo170]